MTEENYQRIKVACLAAQLTGVVIVRGVFEAGDCACAIACFANHEKIHNSNWISDSAAALECTEGQVWEFIIGFDDPQAISDSPYRAAGRRLSKELGL